MRGRPTSADVATEAGVSRTTVSFVLNGRTDVKIPAETRRACWTRRTAWVPPACAGPPAGGRSLARPGPGPAPDPRTDGLGRRPGRDAARAGHGGAHGRVPGHGRAARPQWPRTRRTRACCVRSTPMAWSSGDRAATTRSWRPWSVMASRSSCRGAARPRRDQRGRRQRRRRAAAPSSISWRIGHRRIACITNAPLVYTAAQERLEGYRRALAEAGIGSTSLIAGPRSMPRAGTRRWPGCWSGRSTPSSWPATSWPSAPSVRCATPAGGSRTTSASSASTTSRSPPTSTLPHHRPAAGLRARAGRRTGALLERIADPAIPRRTLLPTELIVRASTAPPPRVLDALPSRRHATARRRAGGPGKGDGSMEERTIRWRRTAGLIAALAIVAAALRRRSGGQESAAPGASVRITALGRRPSRVVRQRPAASPARTSAARSRSTRRGPAPSRTTSTR